MEDPQNTPIWLACHVARFSSWLGDYEQVSNKMSYEDCERFLDNARNRDPESEWKILVIIDR